jgi:hypothetical protein
MTTGSMGYSGGAATNLPTPVSGRRKTPPEVHVRAGPRSPNHRSRRGEVGTTSRMYEGAAGNATGQRKTPQVRTNRHC